MELNVYLNGENLNCPLFGIKGTVYPVFYGKKKIVTVNQYSKPQIGILLWWPKSFHFSSGRRSYNRRCFWLVPPPTTQRIWPDYGGEGSFMSKLLLLPNPLVPALPTNNNNFILIFVLEKVDKIECTNDNNPFWCDDLWIKKEENTMILNIWSLIFFVEKKNVTVKIPNILEFFELSKKFVKYKWALQN